MPLFKFNPQQTAYEKTITVTVAFDDVLESGLVFAETLIDGVAFSSTLEVPGEFSNSVTDTAAFDDSISDGFIYEDTLAEDVTFDDSTAIVEGVIFEDTLLEQVVFDELWGIWLAFEFADDVVFDDQLESWFAYALTEQVTFDDALSYELVVQPAEIIDSVYFHADLVALTNLVFLTDGVKFYSQMDGGHPNVYEEFLSDRVAFDNFTGPGNHLYEVSLEDKAIFFDTFLPLSYTITWRCRTRTPGVGFGGVEYGYEKGYGEGTVLDVASTKIEVYSTDLQSNVRSLKRTVIIPIADPSDPDADASWTYTEEMNRQDHDGQIRGHKIGFRVVQVDHNGKESTM